MDPNTGRLIPGGPEAGGRTDAGSQGSPGASLLQTPPLGSAHSIGMRRAPPTAGPSRLRFASQPGVPADPDAEAAGPAEDEAVRCP